MGDNQEYTPGVLPTRNTGENKASIEPEVKADPVAAVKKPARTKQFTSSFGNEYTFQRLLPSGWLNLIDGIRENGNKNIDLYQAILSQIVVVPGSMNVDDFELESKYGGYAELEEVVAAAKNFQQGKQI